MAGLALTTDKSMGKISDIALIKPCRSLCIPVFFLGVPCSAEGGHDMATFLTVPEMVPSSCIFSWVKEIMQAISSYSLFRLVEDGMLWLMLTLIKGPSFKSINSQLFSEIICLYLSRTCFVFPPPLPVAITILLGFRDFTKSMRVPKLSSPTTIPVSGVLSWTQFGIIATISFSEIKLSAFRSFRHSVIAADSLLFFDIAISAVFLFLLS